MRAAVLRRLLPFDWAALWLRADLRQARSRRDPKTFTEKVCHKLVYDRRPIARIYADKLAVRDYVGAICSSVRLPRLLGRFEAEEDIPAALPAAPWVMKASHGSGMNLICDRPGAVSGTLVHRSAHRWLQRDYAVRFWEWQYLRLPRRILFEEYLGNGRQTPDDFKFYVMNQKVRFIEVDQARYIRHTRDFFWPDWSPVHSRIGPAPTAAVLPARPARLAHLIEIAETLAQDTDFLRVDLYAIGDEIYFGELTHSPAAGHFGFADPALDAELGSYWSLPARYDDTLSVPTRVVQSKAIVTPTASVAG